MEVIKVTEWRRQTVDSSGSLNHDLIGIVLRVEDDRISGDAVPALAAGRVLHEIDPFIAGRDLLMLVTVPFSDFSPIGVTKIFENIKLVVEIVEDDDFRVIFHNLQHGNASGLVRIYHAAPVHTKLRSRFNRTVFPRVPAISRNIFIEWNVVGNRHILMMRCGVPLELHRHENAIAQTDQPSGVEIPVNLWIL